MKLRLTALGSVLIIVALAACGGGHGGSTLPTTNSGAAYNGATTFDWGKEQLDGAVYSGPVKLAHMQVAVVVKQQNLAGLISYAQQVSDPRSPMFRMFLTPQEIAARFGASQSDYQAAANYFVGKGLSVSGWPQRLALSVAGSQAAMEKAFGTTFGTYSKDGFNFVGPVGTPHFASAVPITAVSNLVAMHTMHTYVIPAPPRANGNSSSGYSPQQIRNAFDFTGAYNAGYTGSGITIGIIGTGPINVTRPASGNPACGADADLAALKSVYGVSAVGTECERDVTTSGVSAGLSASGIPTASPTWSPVPNGTPSPNPGQSPSSMFPYSGDFQSPPPVASSSCSTSTALPACNPEDLEAQLDTQQTAMLAPGSTVDFYLGYNASDCLVYFPDRCASSGSNSGTAYIGIVEADPEIQQLIAENVADTVSISYGNGETQNVGSGFDAAGVGYQTAEYAEMAAEGIAVFASSGDSGVAECLGGVNGYLSQTCVSYPSGDPNVTSVGGVNAPIDEFGQLVTNMTAWGVTNGGNGGTIPKNASGSGGGTSTIFAAPSWQQTAIGATMREQPDVSMLADPATGVTAVENGAPTTVGGTSVAAPEMAAMWALVLQACKVNPACVAGGPAAHPYRLGNAAPYLYSIYHGSNLAPVGNGVVAGMPFLPYAQVFYDVVYGNTAMPGTNPGTPVPGQTAGTGYDEATGVGVPFARHLIEAVTNR